MKKGLLIFICFLLVVRAMKAMMNYRDLNAFFIPNEAMAFHSGQIIGLTIKVLGSLGLSWWLWRKYMRKHSL